VSRRDTGRIYGTTRYMPHIHAWSELKEAGSAGGSYWTVARAASLFYFETWRDHPWRDTRRAMIPLRSFVRVEEKGKKKKKEEKRDGRGRTGEVGLSDNLWGKEKPNRVDGCRVADELNKIMHKETNRDGASVANWMANCNATLLWLSFIRFAWFDPRWEADRITWTVQA